MLLFNLVTILLIGIGLYQFRVTQVSQKKRIEQGKLLAKQKALVQQLLTERDQWLKQSSLALHSNLKSKIHAIDLVLYRLKKHHPYLELQESIAIISEATAASLQLIDKIGGTLPLPNFDSRSWLPAIRELVDHLDANIYLNVPLEEASMELDSTMGEALYMLIKSWLEKAIDDHRAGEIFVEWQPMHHHWCLFYKDDGRYPATLDDSCFPTLVYLTTLQAEIRFEEVSMSGRTIILVGDNA